MLQARLRQFLLVQACATALCVVTELLCRFAFKLHGIYSWPLIHEPGEFFPDFDFYIGYFDHFHSVRFFNSGQPRPFNYPAPAGLLYELFHPWGTGHQRDLIFACALVGVFLWAAALFTRALIARGLPPRTAAGYTALGVLLSYPFWFAVQRGNIEMFVWAICALGVWALYRGHPHAAATAFALAGSMKLYPLIYFGLLIARRDWKRVLYGALATVLFTLVSLWLICPNLGIAIHGVLAGIRDFNEQFVLHGNRLELSFDHSLFGLYKRLLSPSPTRLASASRFYLVVAALTGTALFFLRLTRLPFATQTAVLTTLMVLLPPVSFDYTLLHLYTVIGILLLAAGQDTRQPSSTSLALLALATSFLTEWIRHGATLEGQLRGLCLTGLVVVLLLQHDSPASRLGSNDEFPAEQARELP